MTPDEYERLKAEADEMQDDGDVYGAIDAYAKLLQDRPEDDEILVARSAAYIEMQEYRAAVNDAVAAWRLDRESAVAAFNAGLALDLDGESREAVTWFQRAIVLDPEFGKAYAGLANTYYELEDYGSAVANYALAERHEADFEELSYWWGRALIGLGAYEDAIDRLEQGVADAPNPEVEAALGQAYYLVGETDLAQALLNKALGAEPDDHDSLLYYTAILRQEGMSEDEVRAWIASHEEPEVHS